mgnify:CR=1 FL=1
MKKTIPILLLILFFVAAAWYSLTREPDPIHEIPPPSVVLEPAVEETPVDPWPEEPVPEEEPEPAPLPDLDESDEWIERELEAITGSDDLVQFLVKDQLVSRLVAAVDTLDSRQVPAQVIPVKSPEGKFKAGSSGEKAVLGGDNFVRYDGHVGLLQQLDSAALVGIYKYYYPLFQQAWEDNGGEGSFNDRFLEIIDHLLETPEVNSEIELVKPEAVYLYEDPELEALSAGQKILLRMGPDNAALVKAKLTELRDRVGVI